MGDTPREQVPTPVPTAYPSTDLTAFAADAIIIVVVAVVIIVVAIIVIIVIIIVVVIVVVVIVVIVIVVVVVVAVVVVVVVVVAVPYGDVWEVASRYVQCAVSAVESRVRRPYGLPTR